MKKRESADERLAEILHGFADWIRFREKGLLTAQHLAETLSISLVEVYRMAGDEIPYVKLGRRKLFRREDVDQLIKDRTVRPRPAALALRGAR